MALLGMDVRPLPDPSVLGDALFERWHHAQHHALRLLVGPASGVWHLAMSAGRFGADRAATEAYLRAFDALLLRDLENAREGLYPRELLLRSGLLREARHLPAVIADLPWILRRRQRRRFRELPPRIRRDGYPRYYLRNFHWQSDGWFSERSARLYEVGVELLFQGTASVMRRMALAPLARTLRGKPHARLLDIGCGTGRFLGDVHAALPDLRLYGLDLSPYYLLHARGVLAGVPEASLVAENAEHMPFGDGLFDAACSVFLFHEMPGDVRRRVVAEALRVLAPGGTFVVCDSIQSDDAERLGLSGYASWFPRLYHEPYYASYLRDDLVVLLQDQGFVVEASEPHLVSKVVVARKPARSRRRRPATPRLAAKTTRRPRPRT